MLKVAFSNYTLGAGAATALVNTAPAVRRSTGEALLVPADLERFLDEQALHPGVTHGPLTDEDLQQVHVLRREIRMILEAGTEEDAVREANALVTRASTGPVLQRDDADGSWQWYAVTSPQASLAEELGVVMGAGMLGVVRSLSHARFRGCESPVCDGMFIDTSRAGRRRYCMPDVCGNRLNVANHRARRRGHAKDA